ncbi:hypothetical protein VTL71DRAFT_10148 [Oculimacula yallundae]|uniref:Uncharacterized protein n=1 Tax=Oculimacula yallundae TaxID=86028 RepID=A0ABR4BRR0_9HELO
MVVLLLTFLAGKVIYDEHKERKIRKAKKVEAKAEALEGEYQALSEPINTANLDNSPFYVASQEDFGPPAYHKDAQVSSALPSGSLISLKPTDTVPIPEKNPARFLLA